MRFDSDRQEEELSAYDTPATLESRKTGLNMVYVYVAVGLGLVSLMLAFVVAGKGGGREEINNRLQLIEQRLDDMEFRLGNLSQNDAAAGELAALRKTDEDLGRRFDALEKKLEGRLNLMSAAMTKLEKKAMAPPPPPPAAPKAPAKPKTRLHTVQKGETLYKISGKYGMSIEELRKLNSIGPDFKIYPGQKLKVAGKP
jgi:LysM repeat protein